MDTGYFLLVIVSTLIGGLAQTYVTSQINKYQTVPTSTGLTGALAASRMLDYQHVLGVPVSQGKSGQDYFDPITNTITIDPHAYNSNSITAMATACHEAGHACQYAEGFWLMKLRTNLVPLVNFSSKVWVIFLIIGISLYSSGAMGAGNALLIVAIALYAFAVLFHLVTLPVEFDASNRALKYLEATGLPENEHAACYSVLRACALTYVAAALVSVFQLLWLLGQRR